MENNIKGKVIVITGAGSGFGEISARHLSGRIISVSSVAEHTISPCDAVYSASKYAVRVISEA